MTDGNPLEVNNGLYEGDIVLTPQQEVQMMARRVVNNNAFWWPRNSKGIVNVDYRFGDEFVSKTGVKKAISAWESHTCIRFHELSKPKQSPHLIFVTSNGCASNVGRIYFSRSGQKVWLAPGCFSNPGTPIHEIGHALGFNHEQARSDRDDHVDIVFDNVVPGRERNFQKRNTNNFDVPYDYFSLMHYGSSYFSKNGLSTIVPKNPLAESLLGNRADFSFWDLKLVNLQYRCTRTGKYIQELKAPECHKVQLVFSEFVLMQRPDSPVPCLYQGLTLRLQDPPIDSNVFGRMTNLGVSPDRLIIMS
ncbi:hypothetical protein HAZT_HAZT010096 [Hyalella azteca]|uniref:Metalloendopeptidase n=1 Tax=Hyalella azteca TaxID=294128 RepID=A0A6A0GVG3_HYAAZ|nr:hypothetical protein HAZT_HAZT010096 [Hyalella azteca]